MDAWLLVLVGLVGLALSAVGGWPLTTAVLQLASRSTDAGHGPSGDTSVEGDPTGPDATDDAGAAPDVTSEEGLRGGTWIGILERLAITGSLLAGYPAGIAFVIAIKGLGRYPELRENPSTSERFVIGTFASMLWAVAVGAAMRAVMGA
ncbi:hypothetical protein [Actinotalea subterranea]|uniref:hypothetical protein n=1 Tax=Actinotalea subterranea TaxID=2607497 RepID=UPI0011EC0DE5|nr:hypothetical protein [Actinotalea subterranea]